MSLTPSSFAVHGSLVEVHPPRFSPSHQDRCSNCETFLGTVRPRGRTCCQRQDGTGSHTDRLHLVSQSKATATADYSTLPYLILTPVIGRGRVGLPPACYHKLPSTRSLGRSLGPKIHSRSFPTAGRWCEKHEQSVVRWSRGGYGLTRRTVADPSTLHRSQADTNGATRPGMAPSPPTGCNQSEAKRQKKPTKKKKRGGWPCTDRLVPTFRADFLRESLESRPGYTLLARQHQPLRDRANILPRL